MPLHPTLQDLALRVVLTLIAGGLIGFNRGVSGHAAGLRTTILVGLAACLAMMQANLLLVSAVPNGGVRADVMRLALGILSGVGFIGGGTILRRGELVTGVTTAATLWFITVVGLCFGGGQLWLGAAGSAIGFLVVSALKWAELRMPRDQRALLKVRGPDVKSVRRAIAAALPSPRFHAMLVGVRQIAPGEVELDHDLRWRALPHADGPVEEIGRLGADDAVTRADWSRWPSGQDKVG
jgi:putative Mg2+ transporter-C (MgtC) family protein